MENERLNTRVSRRLLLQSEDLVLGSQLVSYLVPEVIRGLDYLGRPHQRSRRRGETVIDTCPGRGWSVGCC